MNLDETSVITDVTNDNHRDTRKRKIRLKCECNGELRVILFSPEQTTFAQLKKRLSLDYGFEVSLKYEDNDGDLIILSSQNDLDDLFASEIERDTVNVFVTESNNLLPALARRDPTKQQIFPANNNANVVGGGIGGSSNQSFRQDLRSSTAVSFERFPQIDSPAGIAGSSISQQPRRNNIRWKRGEVLGQGAFGVVYLGLNVETGELMAVKQMAIEELSKKDLSSLENEINLLRSFRQPNIVRYIGTEINQSHLSIFLEYVPGGSLKALIDKFGALEESVAKSYTRQLLIGLEYLHRNGVAHRDIKGANCLVGNDGVIKLADFGSSKQWRATATVTETMTSNGDMKGTTPSWMAPEIIREKGNEINWKKADVWSLACTTVEMTTGKPPWSQFNNSVTTLYHIACTDALPEYPSPASMELLTFLNVCLTRDATNRPDITSLLLHPFVTNMGPLFAGSGVFAGSNARPSTVSNTSVGEWDVSGSWRRSTVKEEGLGLVAASSNSSLKSHGNNHDDSSSTGGGGVMHSSMGATGDDAEEIEDFLEENNADTYRAGIIPRPYELAQRYEEQQSRTPPQHPQQPPQKRLHHLAQPLDGSGENSGYLDSNPNSMNRGLQDSLLASSLENSLDHIEEEEDLPNATGGGEDNGIHLNHGSRQDGLSMNKNNIGGGTLQHRGGVSESDDDGSVTSLTSKPYRTRKGRSVSVNNNTTMVTAALASVGATGGTSTVSTTQQTGPSGVTIKKSKFALDAIETSALALAREERERARGRRQRKEKATTRRNSGVLAAAAAAVAGSIGVGGTGTPVDDDSVIGGGVSDNDDSSVNRSMIRSKAALAAAASKQQLSGGKRSADQQNQQQQQLRGSKSSDTATQQQQQQLQQQLGGRRSNDQIDTGGSSRKLKKASSGTIARNNPLLSGVHSPERQQSLKKLPSMRGPLISPSNSTSLTSSPALSNLSSIAVPMPMSTSTLISGHYGHSLAAAMGAAGGGEDETEMASLGSYDDAIGSGFQSDDREQFDDGSDGGMESRRNSLSTHTAVQSPITTHQHQQQSASIDSQQYDDNNSNTIVPQPVRERVISMGRDVSSPLRSPMGPLGMVFPFNGSPELPTATLKTVRGPPPRIDAMASYTDANAGTSLASPSSHALRSPKKLVDFNLTSGGGNNSGGDTLGIMGVGTSLIENELSSQLRIQPLSTVKSSRQGDRRDRDTRENRMERNGSTSSSYGLRKSTTVDPVSPPLNQSSSAATVLEVASLGPVVLRIHGTATGSRTVTAASMLRDGSGGGMTLDSRSGRVRPGSLDADPSDYGLLKSRVGTGIRLDSDDDNSVTSLSSKQHKSQRKGTTSGGGYASFFDRERGGSVGSMESEDEDRDDHLGNMHQNNGNTVFSAPMVLEEHTLAVTRLRCAKRFNLLLSSSSDGTIRVWTPGETHSRLVLDCATFAQQLGEPNDINLTKVEPGSILVPGDVPKRIRVSNFWSQSGCETIWAACSDCVVRVWNGSDGRALRALRGHEDNVTAMEGLNNQGNLQSSSCLVATGSTDKTVRVWDVRARKAQAFTFRGHTDSVLTVRFSEGGGGPEGTDVDGAEGGKILVSGGKDKTIRIWDMRGGRLRATLEKHFGSVSSVKFLPPGVAGTNASPAAAALGLGQSTSTFVSGGRDSIINLWDDSGDCIGAQAGHRGAATFFSEFNYNFNLKPSMGKSPASSKSNTLGSPIMLSAGADNIIKIWDMRRFRSVSEIHVGSVGGPLTKAVWAGSGTIISASGGNIRMWDYQSNETGNMVGGNSFDVGDGDLEGTVGGTTEWRSKNLASHAQPCTDLISTDTFVASASKSGQIYVWG